MNERVESVLLVVAAAALGGLAAHAGPFPEPESWITAGLAAAVAVVGIALATGKPERRTGRPLPSPTPAASTTEAPSAGETRPADRVTAVAGAERPPAASPLDLSRYQRHDRRRADPQCPHCGRFEIDVGAGDASLRLVCAACRWTGEWTPGEPWPDVVVRADMRDASVA